MNRDDWIFFIVKNGNLRSKYNELAVSTAGIITQSTIVNEQVRLSFKLAAEPNDQLFWAIFPASGKAILLPVPLPAGRELESRQFDIPAGHPVLAALGLVLRRNGVDFLLDEEPRKSDLRRLLARNGAELNERLRWVNRIVDLNTRFFAAKNSIRFRRDSYWLIARCLVSVGYEAMEHVHAAKIEWAETLCRDLLDRLSTERSIDVRASVIVFWLHLCIYRQDTAAFANSIDTVIDILPGKLDEPIAAYNLLHIMILQAGYLVATQDTNRLIRLTAYADEYFRAAAIGYPRALVNFGELTVIAHKNFIVQCAYLRALGKISPSDGPVPEFTPELAWEEGNRIRDGAAKRRFAKNYLEMCSSFT